MRLPTLPSARRALATLAVGLLSSAASQAFPYTIVLVGPELRAQPQHLAVFVHNFKNARLLVPRFPPHRDPNDQWQGCSVHHCRGLLGGGVSLVFLPWTPATFQVSPHQFSWMFVTDTDLWATYARFRQHVEHWRQLPEMAHAFGEDGAALARFERPLRRLMVLPRGTPPDGEARARALVAARDWRPLMADFPSLRAYLLGMRRGSEALRLSALVLDYVGDVEVLDAQQQALLGAGVDYPWQAIAQWLSPPPVPVPTALAVHTAGPALALPVVPVALPAHRLPPPWDALLAGPLAAAAPLQPGPPQLPDGPPLLLPRPIPRFMPGPDAQCRPPGPGDKDL